MTNLVYVPLFIPSPSHTGKLNTLPIHQKVSLDDLSLLSIEEKSSLSSFFQSADGRPLRTVSRQKLVGKSVDWVPALVLVHALLHPDRHLEAVDVHIDLDRGVSSSSSNNQDIANKITPGGRRQWPRARWRRQRRA